MKLVIGTKFHVNRMNCVGRKGGGWGPIDLPPSKLRVTMFSSRLLGLISNKELLYGQQCFTGKKN